MPAKPQALDLKPITYEAKLDPELIIKSVLEHFTYLKLGGSIIIILHLLSGTHHVLFASSKFAFVLRSIDRSCDSLKKCAVVMIKLMRKHHAHPQCIYFIFFPR